MKFANIFDNPQLYKLFQSALISTGSKLRIRNEVIKPIGVNRVLDFGCGIGNLSEDFRNADYLGIEPLPSCVDKANRLYKTPRTNFIVGDHSYLNSIPDSSFDLVIAIGVLHHIDDHIFSEFVREAERILTPGGRLTTFDPVFHANQSKLSRWVVSRDRGVWVRSVDDYLQPIRAVFSSTINFKIYSGLLRIPYDHLWIELKKHSGAVDLRL